MGDNDAGERYEPAVVGNDVGVVGNDVGTFLALFIRAPAQPQIELFWDDAPGPATPPKHRNEIATDVALRPHNSLLTDARIFAMLDSALADAAITCWDSKYTYNFWRPVTAIQDADQDGNPQTTADPTWSPLITTPAFPSYVSGHSIFSAAAATILTHAFVSNVHLTVASDGLPGVVRHFRSFEAAAQEAGMSRIYGGIHYPFDNVEGQALGQAVGQYVLQHWNSQRS
jgi:membrane-associated phospholipid phosphatase